MRTKIKLNWIVLIMLFTFTITQKSQAQSIEEFFINTQSSLEYSKFDSSEIYLKHAEKLLTKSTSNEYHYLEYLSLQTKYCVILAKFDQAAKWVKQIERKLSNVKESIALAHCYESLANYYFERYNTTLRSRLYYYKAIAIKYRLLKNEYHPEIIQTRTLLSILYHKSYGSPQNINGYLSRLLSEDNLRIYDSLSIVAPLYYGQSMRVSSLSYSFFTELNQDRPKARKIMWKLHEFYQKEYPNPTIQEAYVYHNLANLYSQGSNDFITHEKKAIPLNLQSIKAGKEAYRLRKKLLGEHHYYTAFACYLVGNGYWKAYLGSTKLQQDAWLDSAIHYTILGLKAMVPEYKGDQIQDIPEINSIVYPRYVDYLAAQQSGIIELIIRLKKYDTKEQLEELMNAYHLAIRLRKQAGRIVQSNAIFDFKDDKIGMQMVRAKMQTRLISSITDQKLRNKAIEDQFLILQEDGHYILQREKERRWILQNSFQNKKWHSLSQSINRLKVLLEPLENPSEFLKNFKEVSFLKERLLELYKQRAVLEMTFKESFDKREEIPPLSIHQVQQQLSDSLAFVHLDLHLHKRYSIRGRHKVYAFFSLAVLADTVISNYQEYTSDQLMVNIELLRSYLTKQNKQQGTSSIYHFSKASASVFQKLFGSYAKTLKNKHIVLILNGLTEQIPYSALLTHLPSDNTALKWGGLPYFITKYSYSRNYSESIYFYEKKKNNHKEAASLFGLAPYGQKSLAKNEYDKVIGNSFSFEKKEIVKSANMALPSSALELEGISRIVDGDFLFEQEATKQVFLESYKDYDILHITSHSDTLGNTGFISFYDQSLSTHEVAALDFTNKKLVVLSSCISGNGLYDVYNGINSLSYHFMCAGAESSISSLWYVDDRSSAMIFPNFYYYLKKGYDKAQALQSAQQHYLNSSVEQVEDHYKQPYYWASWYLQGNHTSLNLNSPHSLLSTKFWIGSIAVGLILIILFIKNKSKSV